MLHKLIEFIPFAESIQKFNPVVQVVYCCKHSTTFLQDFGLGMTCNLLVGGTDWQLNVLLHFISDGFLLSDFSNFTPFMLLICELLGFVLEYCGICKFQSINEFNSIFVLSPSSINNQRKMTREQTFTLF